MKISSLANILILVLFLQVFNSCSKTISKNEIEEFIQITESKKIDYSFNAKDLEVIIYDSKIKNKREMSILISSIFFKNIVLKRDIFFNDGLVKLIFVDTHNTNSTYTCKYKDLIILDNLEKNLYELVNSDSSDKKYYVENTELLNKIDSIFDAKNQINNLKIFKFDIENTYSIYLTFNKENQLEKYQFNFNKQKPYKLFNIDKQ